MDINAHCSDCGKQIADGEAHYDKPLLRCEPCGDRMLQGGFTHYGEQL